MRRVNSVKLIAIAGVTLIVTSVCFLERASTHPQDSSSQLTQQAAAIIQAKCSQCHAEEKMSGLDLRTREGALKGGTRGAAIVPGDSAGSTLYRMVAGQIKPAMPLGETLPPEQIAILKKWIDAGAGWPDASVTAKEAKPANYTGSKIITEEQRRYWAFQKPARPIIPHPKNAAWVRNPIDAFVLAALEKKGLAPSPPADKRTLLRRVTFDLTGLPPTPGETEAFLSDQSPEAYEKVVRRLLNSPAYGERWAQHWLDVVRFAETNGYELDADREQAWRYRDYVVRSLNEDKPYDRFILEQLAGDELTPPDAKDAFEMRVATGFLRAGPQHVVAGNQDEAVNRQEWLTEAAGGTAATFLGLTVGCARCHDHKFDPIPQADYYRLQAFFAATDNKTFDGSTIEQKRAREAAVKAHDERLKPINKQIEEIERPYRERLAEEKRRALEPKYKEALADRVSPCRSKDDGETQTEQAANIIESPTRSKELIKEACRMLSVKWDELVPTLSPDDLARRAALRRRMHELELNAPPPLDAALAVADSRNPVPPIHILRGGDPHVPGEEVRPRFLSVTLRDDAPPEAEPAPLPREVKSTGRRAALARWIAQPGHPLTARVMVNRLWQHHFGRGIVGTPNDFGRNGQQPTHPELLDWLATEFVAGGWSLKAMHELMVLSNTYQQSSAHDSNKARRDPENHLLWRMNRQRLDAEALRDAVLATAGTLTTQLGGPPVRVPLEPEVYDTIFTEEEPDNLWPVTPDARQHTRRSLYLIRKRNVRLPMMVAFDAPDMMSSCAARAVSVHSLQALTLMNSDFMFQQSRALAARLFREGRGDERQMLTRLFLITLSRPPQLAERVATEKFLREQAAIIRQRIRRGEQIAELKGVAEKSDVAIAAAWVDLCLATLNRNEFVYVR